MQYEVVIEPIVDENLEDIAFYISLDNPLRAITFVNELKNILLSLSSLPHRFQRLGQYRRLVYGKYIALYTIDEENKRVVIKYVGEGHRNLNA